MVVAKQHDKSIAFELGISLWLKCATTIFLLDSVILLVRSLVGVQKWILGLPATKMAIVSLVLLFFCGLLQVAFCFFSKTNLALFLYWLLRYLKGPISVFSLLGLVYLLTIRTPLFSLEFGVSLASLFFLFLIGFLTKPIERERFPFPEMERLFTPIKIWTKKLNSIPSWILSLAVALLPVLIVCCVIYFGLHAQLSDYRPYSFWNDETSYWMSVRAFSHAGFNVGYNAPNELIARAEFNHYGVGSTLYYYLYGSIGRLVGWTPELPLLINFAILPLAILAFACFTRLNAVQIFFTGLVTTITWPVLLYLPMTTTETLNQVIGIILSSIFFVLLTRREKVSPGTRVAFIFFMYFATLIRLSWGLMLVPVLFYSLGGMVFFRSFFSIFMGLGLYVSAVFITGYLVPPMNNSIFSNLKASFVSGPQVLLQAMWGQVEAMFSIKQLSPNSAVMFQIFAIVGWNLVRLARQIRLKVSWASIVQSRAVFEIYNMSMLVIAGFMFYLQMGFSRTFAPSMMVVYLLQVAKKDYKFLGTFLAINVMFFSSYMTFPWGEEDPQVIKMDFTAKFPQLASSQAKIEKLVVYDPAARNSWCNTLLIPLDFYDYRVTVIPPGIGISCIHNPVDIKFPIKSNYLLLNPVTYAALSDKSNLVLLDSLPIGDLYRNLDSGCGLSK